ncbi:hypothetical protein SUGI_0611560 [Cryptomeria japonica]|nr:hypothetical protein SUGI_0611560 [Cryptomeria japonica]
MHHSSNCNLVIGKKFVEEKEQSDHLLLPSEKDELKEIAREAQQLSLPLGRPHLRGNDGIFHGERSRVSSLVVLMVAITKNSTAEDREIVNICLLSLNS